MAAVAAAAGAEGSPGLGRMAALSCARACGEAVLGTPLHLQEPFWLPPP